jgi:hypothetical protein
VAIDNAETGKRHVRLKPGYVNLLESRQAWGENHGVRVLEDLEEELHAIAATSGIPEGNW